MKSSFRILFLDLDDTLYSNTTGLWQAIGGRILQYMIEVAGVPADQAPALRDDYFQRYGTTLTGLRIHQGIDPMDYLRYVHALPVEQYLQPDPRTREVLAGVPLRRVILTNADRWHAARVLSRLGLSGLIDQIVDVIDLEWIHKPNEEAYRRAMSLVGETEAGACLLLDDMARNLAPALAIGMTTVLVGGKDPPVDGGFQIGSMHELPRVLEKLGIPQLPAR
jgi:putative hydrolase of the HAD superfamily